MLREIINEKFNTEKEKLITKLKKDWPTIAGDRLSPLSLPYKIDGNILMIKAENAAIRDELNMLKFALLFKIMDRHRIKFKNIYVTLK